MKHIERYLFVAIAAFSMSFVSAESSLESCASIKDDKDILSCHDNLKECTFSNTPLIGGFFDCRQISEREVNSLKKYWNSEDDAELCHYFYFPLSDPTATKELLLANYLIMQNEIYLRGIDCIKDHRNIFWYRGKRTKSMLEKLIIKYDLELNDD